jgi:DNA topoisomerase-1
MWVIDVLALRVGGEKGEDEADTVGCCSLRREHLIFNPDAESYEIELEFLGKDSMQYKQNICFGQYGDLGKLVYRCLKSFCDRKKPDEEVFETLEPSKLNAHLTSLMKGLTAKVFRTFNASITLEKELPLAESLEGLSIQDKVARYNAANREVAILCNHQKTVSKAAETQLENLAEKLATLKQQRAQLVTWRDLVKKGKGDTIPLKDDDTNITEGIKKRLDAAKAQRDKAKTNEEKLKATVAVDEATKATKEDQARRFKENHMFKKAPTTDACEAKIEKFAEQIRKLEIDVRDRDENKEVALGTSKINYMDPRISVAWCKRCEVPIDKIFARTLRDKFNWAMPVRQPSTHSSIPLFSSFLLSVRPLVSLFSPSSFRLRVPGASLPH